MSFSIHYVPTEATHNNTAGLIADMRQRTLRNFQLVFTDSVNTTWSFFLEKGGEVDCVIPEADEGDG